MTDQLPRQFGKYLLERRLGVGGMAETFVARREGKAGIVQHVCIKRVLPAFHRDPEFIKQFQREARLAAKLRHQNIVQVLDFGHVGDTLYMALELVRGVDLRDFLQAQPDKKLTPEYVAIIAHDMIYALDYAHRPHDGVDGIVHRDVTPSNVLLSRNGHAKLADFGVAKAIGTSTVATATGVMKGKMPYMPMEQMKGGAIDGRTDLFSLGVVLFEALAGRRPFTGAHDVEVMTKIVANTRPKLKDVAPHVPDGFCDMVERLLSPAPDDRYPNADAVLDAVAPFVPTPKWRRQLAQMVRDCYGDTERGPAERDTRMADIGELPANVPGAIQVAVPSEPPTSGPVSGGAATALAPSQPPPASDEAPTRVGPSEIPPAGRAGTLYGVGPESEPPTSGPPASTHLDLAAQARAAAAATGAAFPGEPTAPSAPPGSQGEGPTDDPDTDRTDSPVGQSEPESESESASDARLTPATEQIPAERAPESRAPARRIAIAAAALVAIAGGAAALFAAGDPVPEPGLATEAHIDQPPVAATQPVETPAPSQAHGASEIPAGVEPPEPEAPTMEPPSAMAAPTPMGAAHAPADEPPPSAMAHDEPRLVAVTVACMPWGEVWVGERYMGRAPVELRLPPGTHAIRAGAGSPQFTKRIRVRSGRHRMNVVFDLDELMQRQAAMQ